MKRKPKLTVVPTELAIAAERMRHLKVKPIAPIASTGRTEAAKPASRETFARCLALHLYHAKPGSALR